MDKQLQSNRFWLYYRYNYLQKYSIYLKDEFNKIDTIISKSQQEIELLKEYKTALISEVVTGKVDVRNEVLN